MIKIIKQYFIIIALICYQSIAKRIQLERNIVKKEFYNNTIDSLSLGYNYSQNLAEQSENMIKQEIINVGDLQYIGLVYMGEELSPYKFILDTGSTIFWIPGVDCQNVTYSCHSKRVYDFRNSKTATFNEQNKVEIKYGKGECKGFTGTEIVKLQRDGQAININLVFSYYDKDMAGMLAHGIIGLSQSKKEKNYLENAKEQGIISSSVFAFELARIPNSSYFYYDDLPQSKMDNVLFTPSINEERWLIEVIGTYFNDNDHTDISYASGLVDTGSSYLHISQNLFNILVKDYANNICQYAYREYICPCDTEQLNSILPTMKFFIRGGILVVKPEDYVHRQGNNCYLSVDPLSNFNFMIFGDVLLRKHFTVFDKQQERIGFSDVENKLENVKIIILFIFLPLFSVFTLIGLLYIVYKQFKIKSSFEQNSLNQQLLHTNYQTEFFQGRNVRIGSSFSDY